MFHFCVRFIHQRAPTYSFQEHDDSVASEPPETRNKNQSWKQKGEFGILKDQHSYQHYIAKGFDFSQYGPPIKTLNEIECEKSNLSDNTIFIGQPWPNKTFIFVSIITVSPITWR